MRPRCRKIRIWYLKLQNNDIKNRLTGKSRSGDSFCQNVYSETVLP